MTEISLKIRILFILVVILAIAMLFQSIILLFVGLRASIKDDVAWAQRLLKTASSPLHLPGQRALFPPNDHSDIHFYKEYGAAFSCIFIEIRGTVVSAASRCQFQNELINKSQTAKATKKSVIGFAGAGWGSHLSSGEVALFSVPLLDAADEVYGSMNAERSLLPIYSRFQKEVAIALCYLLVNVIVFVTIGFLRFSRILFRPLDKLVLLAENYRPDEQSLMNFGDDESPFRKLSISLNALLDRIRRDNQQLRKTVSYLEIANKDLKEKNELVIRSEKLASTGRLSAGLAHEIGNPLSIIQGYVELLGREDLSANERRQFSENTQLELERIKKLIRQLLDVSRPTLSSEEKVAINSLMKEVINFVSLEKSFTDCYLTTELTAKVDEVVVDKDALRQVIINVLFNAVDAANQRGDQKEIDITTCNEESSHLGSVLVISIKDNGDGIAEGNLKYIFDPFFTTKEVGRGTGLGLFVCHTIMERMGGRITILNRDTQGIEVRIELPLQKTTLLRSIKTTKFFSKDDSVDNK